MTTTSIASTPTKTIYESLGKGAESSATVLHDAQSRFLTLLTAQLKNQDPLNPLDNAEVTSQLAQISTVEGIERLNATLQSLLAGSVEAQAMQAVSLVGHGVLVPNGTLTLQGGVAVGGLELPESADSVTVTIKDANGIVMRTLSLGALDPGVHGFSWDGLTDSGQQAVDGAYSITVIAERGGQSIAVDELAFGIVSSVSRASQGTAINIGGLGAYTMSDIKEIL